MNAEYQALIGFGQEKVILAAFRGKVLLDFGVDVEDNRLTRISE